MPTKPWSTARLADANITLGIDLIDLLRTISSASSNAEARVQAATSLVRHVDALWGEEATKFAAECRAIGGPALLIRSLLMETPECHQMVLVVLGNMASDAFDSQSAATKVALRGQPLWEALAPFLQADVDVGTRCCAAAATQNLCHDEELGRGALDAGVPAALEALVNDGDDATKRYASGALFNLGRACGWSEELTMSETAAEAVADRLETSRDEVAITNGAARRIQLAVRRRAARLAAAPPPPDLCSPPPGATTAPIWGEAVPPPTPADIPRVGAASFWSPVDALGAQYRWLKGVYHTPGSGASSVATPAKGAASADEKENTPVVVKPKGKAQLVKGASLRALGLRGGLRASNANGRAKSLLSVVPGNAELRRRSPSALHL